MSECTTASVTVSAEMYLDFPAGKIWPQLCPVREYSWIEPWECEVVHTVSGYNELGCVFTTDFPTEGGREVWVTSRFDPMERIEFVRVSDWRTIRFEVKLVPDGEGTRLTWTHHVTALNEQGNSYVQGKAEAFARQMAMLEKMLTHYLETGEMLRDGSLGIVQRIHRHVHNRKTG